MVMRLVIEILIDVVGRANNYCEDGHLVGSLLAKS
jgi:hypothetical protein